MNEIKVLSFINFKLLKKFLRYNLVGITGTLLYLLTLFIFVQIFHWPPVLSAVLAFFLNIICNFILNYRWVFQTTRSPTATLTRFFAVSILGLLLNTSIMFLVVHILVWPYYFGVFIAMLILPLTNFLLHHFWSLSD